GPSKSLSLFEAATASAGIRIERSDLARWTRMPDDAGFEVPLLPTEDAVAVFDRMRSGPRFGEGYRGVWSAFPVTEFHETQDKQCLSLPDGARVGKGRSFARYAPQGGAPAGHADETKAIAKLQSKRMSSRSAFKGRFSAAVLADPATHPFCSARL